MNPEHTDSHPSTSSISCAAAARIAPLGAVLSLLVVGLVVSACRPRSDTDLFLSKAVATEAFEAQCGGSLVTQNSASTNSESEEESGACAESGDGGVGDGSCQTSSRPEHAWAISDACLRITYDVDLEPMRPALTEAVHAWNAACSAICIAEPVASADADSICKIHVRSNQNRLSMFDDNYDNGGLPTPDTEVVVQSVFSLTTGETVSVDVQLLVDDLGERAAPRFMDALGHALGLDHARTGESSVLLPYDMQADSVTDRDRAALIAKYGEKATCED
ncbi:MAG: hypothetical protein H6729_07635 [Deltaproteobacteria bacterium]|nr:hypothetical protein [Deltaproteobacteria bacterium]